LANSIKGGRLKTRISVWVGIRHTMTTV